ncbi:MAG: hypothetical protein AAGI52_13480 [Bacteroidota bacterium]
MSTFAEKGVEYLLIGGYAVNYYGYVRYTGDLDLWVRPTEENAKRVVEALTAFGFGVAALSEEAILSPRVVTRMGVPPYRLEILSDISGVTFEECWADRIEDEWNGVPVTIIGLGGLRKNKRASGRLKDLADLEELPPE